MWFCHEHLMVRSRHASARLQGREAHKDMLHIRFTGRFCSLRASASG